MTANTGIPPRLPVVTIRLRNGKVIPDTEPRKWRWTMNDPNYPAAGFDVAEWRAG